MSLGAVLHKLRDGENLSAAEAHDVFNSIFDGNIPEAHVAALLLALHRKGETPEEILGAASSMREKALTISAPEDAIDIVGTGGDAKGTFNISTAAALVVAGCDVPVAKHGNRAATSKSGSSDVLAALGVNLEPSFDVLEECLHEAGVCFLYAPRHHPSMRFVAPVRKKLGVRTIFNLLGPLTNPANVKKHLIGVFAPEWLMPMAHVLHSMGSVSAWITHGMDGMDEITTTAPTDVVGLRAEQIWRFKVEPEDAGMDKSSAEGLLGGDAAKNAEALLALLGGAKSAYRDIVSLNAAAALVMSGTVPSLYLGAAMVNDCIDSGAAHDVLQRLISITNRGRA